VSRAIVSAATAALMLSACATAPAPGAPRIEAPTAWQAGAETTAPAGDAYWRAITVDPVLQALLEEAGAVADVAIAEARLAEAEAQLRAAQSSLFPIVSGGGSTSVSGGDRGVGIRTEGLNAAITAPLDLFGAIRDRAAAAASRAEFAAAERDGARLNARRSAGQLYAALRAAQASEAAAERQTRDAEESLALAQSRVQAGLENGLALAQAQSAADAARARIPAFAQAQTSARLGLEALLGASPGALRDRLQPAPFAPIAADRLLEAPFAVIARRPDIRAAEARLRAAGLDAAAARADRWPTASLAAVFSQTSATRGLDGAAASSGLSLAATLFDFGRLQALADAAGARADAEAALFQRTVQFAFSGVEREADRFAQADREAEASRAAAASARTQTDLARARYTSGLSSFIDVLLAQRALADAEIALAAAEGRRTDAAISLAAEAGLGQGR
jgi:NodT family efflux transporter outer membrane factor (OMF) lipoprotein